MGEPIPVNGRRPSRVPGLRRGIVRIRISKISDFQDTAANALTNPILPILKSGKS